MILSPTPLQTHTQGRLRELPRIEVLGTLEGRVETADIPLKVLDISLSGFGVESQKPFDVGAVHRFRFTTVEGATVTLKATAVHCDRRPTRDGSDLFLTGFRFFEDASADQTGTPGELIDRILSVVSFDIQ